MLKQNSTNFYIPHTCSSFCHAATTDAPVLQQTAIGNVKTAIIGAVIGVLIVVILIVILIIMVLFFVIRKGRSKERAYTLPSKDLSMLYLYLRLSSASVCHNLFSYLSPDKLIIILATWQHTFNSHAQTTVFMLKKRKI